MFEPAAFKTLAPPKQCYRLTRSPPTGFRGEYVDLLFRFDSSPLPFDKRADFKRQPFSEAARVTLATLLVFLNLFDTARQLESS